jgi:hypothetical protein
MKKNFILAVLITMLLLLFSCSTKCPSYPAQQNDLMMISYQSGALPYAAYNGVSDCTIVASTPNTPNNTNYMYIGSFERILIKFDVSGIAPINSVIVRAYLILTVASYTGTLPAVAAYPLDELYDPGTATWNDRFTGLPWTYTGGDYGSRVSDIVTFAGHDAQLVLTLDNSLIQNWINGTAYNNGLIIIAQNESTLSGEYSIRSSDYASADYRPKLVVYYRLP